jgi:hypothetical protein
MNYTLDIIKLQGDVKIKMMKKIKEMLPGMSDMLVQEIAHESASVAMHEFLMSEVVKGSYRKLYTKIKDELQFTEE